jgi:hypothetical protein
VTPYQSRICFSRACRRERIRYAVSLLVLDWTLQDFAHQLLPVFDYAEVPLILLVLFLRVHIVYPAQWSCFRRWFEIASD